MRSTCDLCGLGGHFDVRLADDVISKGAIKAGRSVHKLLHLAG